MSGHTWAYAIYNMRGKSSEQSRYELREIESKVLEAKYRILMGDTENPQDTDGTIYEE